jgi:hypothetical protein
LKWILVYAIVDSFLSSFDRLQYLKSQTSPLWEDTIIQQ